MALASFIAQVESVMFYDLSVSGAGWGDSVYPFFLVLFNTNTVLCAKRVKNGFLHTSSIISVLLHAIHTQDIST